MSQQPPDPRDFTARRAIVTGASSGIGQATAIELARGGMDVGIAYHENADGIAETKAAIEGLGRRAFVAQSDLADLAGVRIVDELAAELGGLDVFVANAGIGDPYTVEEIDVDAWMRVMNVNLNSAVLCMQKAARIMIDQGTGGRIVAVSSVHDSEPNPMSIAYGASKYGLRGAVETMAQRLTHLYGITANCVGPGEVATPINDMGPEEADRTKTPRPALPGGRPGHPEEIAHAIAFVASARASYMTGSTLYIDGGMRASAALSLQPHRVAWLDATGKGETIET
ncbi:MAG: SDR family oxidoreductase [Pseudomonadota bacterium]